MPFVIPRAFPSRMTVGMMMEKLELSENVDEPIVSGAVAAEESVSTLIFWKSLLHRLWKTFCDVKDKWLIR